MTEQQKQSFAAYVRNFIFGVEDSLVSTAGLLSGIATAGVSRGNILATGVVLIFVEAFSMAVGSFLSERSAEEYLAQAELPTRRSVGVGSIMFISYFATGFIPLFPYLVFDVSIAFPASIIASLITLFILGLVAARVLRIKKTLRSGVRMLVVGGFAIALGVAVGSFVR